MTGQILDFSFQENSGVISGSDGVRYHFDGSDWRGERLPTRGITVAFETEWNQAKNVYLAGKNKIVAGWLAIVVGGLGIHKFYLRFTGPGLVYLLTNIISIAIIVLLMKGLSSAIPISPEESYYLSMIPFVSLIFSAISLPFMLACIPFILVLIILRIIAIIEGIIYLTKSDEEFDRLYDAEKKKWF